MTRSLWLPALLLAFVACRPHPKPPAPGDSTVVVVDSTASDSATVDTFALDTIPEDEGLADTLVPATAADTLIPAGAARHAALPVGGMEVGLSGWKPDQWCGGPFTSTFYQADPKYVMALLRKAHSCNYSLLGVAPRKFYTCNGQTVGPYCEERHLAYIVAFSKAVPADSGRKYARELNGLSLIDDPMCPACYGGKTVPQESIARVARAAKAAMPWLAVGGRIPASYVMAYAPWRTKADTSLDFFWSQYKGVYGDVDAYFAREGKKAADMGMKMGAGANVTHCYKTTDDPPCSPSQIQSEHLAAITSTPATVLCLINGWQADSRTWSASTKPAWATVIAKAQTLPAGDCHRGT